MAWKENNNTFGGQEYPVPGGKEEVGSMYNPRFEKEAFKKEVKQNVKHLFRKEIEEVSQQELYQAVSYAVKEIGRAHV